MADVHGTCDERFSAVADAFRANFERGDDQGASVCITVHGRPVVDLWAGTATFDGGVEAPWAEDTIINVWSTTKTMAALCALVLADRGELDLHAPVARYWPEFAAAGKDGVLVCHLLGHTAGLPGWQEPMAPDDLYDWELATSRLAAQATWWEPGTQSGYHAITQGYLIGEVVRRVTGASIGSWFASEIAGPLGADFHIGTPPRCDGRVAHVIPPPPLVVDGADPASVAVRALSNPVLDAAASATIPWRRAEIPAAGGHGNARSVARVQSVLACGGELDGIRLLSPGGCAAVFEEQAYGVDLVLGAPMRIGTGYGLVSPEVPLGGERTCFWGGWGGSLVVVDQDAQVCFAYVMNRMGEGTLGDRRAIDLLLAAVGALADL